MRKVALVTGASSGIGQALAHALARRGYAVALAARRRERLNQVALELAQYAVPTCVCVTDLANPLERNRLVPRIRAELGPISCLIHNAGILAGGDLQLSGDHLHQAIATNLAAPMELTRDAQADLIAMRGSVVFVASTAGRVPFPFASLYCATKHGLIGFAESLRYELEQSGVHVLLAFPPMTKSEMTRPMSEALGYDAERLASADRVAEQLVRALLARRRTYIGSWKDRTLMAFQSQFPKGLGWLFRRFQGRFQQMMTPPRDAAANESFNDPNRPFHEG